MSPLVSLPHALTDGTTAFGSQVRENDDAILSQAVNGNLDDANIAVGAQINGNKLSNVMGSRVPTTRIEDDAITAAKLADDPTVDGNRAVTTNHIRDGAVVEAKIGAGAVTNAKLGPLSVSADKLGTNSVISAKVKITNVDWTPGGSVNPDQGTEVDTGQSDASVRPLGVELRFNGAPTGNALELLIVKLWFNTISNTYWISVGNATTSVISLVGATFRAKFIAAS